MKNRRSCCKRSSSRSVRLFPVSCGTSITRCACVSRAGSAFTNQLSRRLQAEFLDFCFPVSGQNEPEVAALPAEIPDPAMFIIDSEANRICQT